MKIELRATFSALLLALVSSEHVNGDCIWYGQCGDDPNTEKPLNCHYTGPAKPLDKDHKQMLRNLCPELVPKTGDAQTCCDASQVESFNENLAVPKNLLQFCPGCWSNFRKYLCQMVCGPDQSNFLHVQKIGDKFMEKGRPILAVEYFMSQSFADGLFNSCINIYSDMMNMFALDIMCGQWGKSHCTSQRWLDFLGDISNDQTPFLINMTLVTSDQVAAHGRVFHPMNVPTTPCDKPVVDGDGSTCSCSDCPAAC